MESLDISQRLQALLIGLAAVVFITTLIATVETAIDTVVDMYTQYPSTNISPIDQLVQSVLRYIEKLMAFPQRWLQNASSVIAEIVIIYVASCIITIVAHYFTS